MTRYRTRVANMEVDKVADMLIKILMKTTKDITGYSYLWEKTRLIN